MFRKAMLSLAAMSFLGSDALAQNGRPSRPGGGGGGMSRPGFGSGGSTSRPGFGSGGSTSRPGFGSGGSTSRPGFGSGGSTSRPNYPNNGSGTIGRPSGMPNNGGMTIRPGSTTVHRPPVTGGTGIRPPGNVGTRPPLSTGNGIIRPVGNVGTRPPVATGNGINRSNNGTINRPTNGSGGTFTKPGTFGTNRPNNPGATGRPNGSINRPWMRPPQSGKTVVVSKTLGDRDYWRTRALRSSFGCYYQGFDHRHWYCRSWSPKHSCWFFFDNGCNAWYYWCQQDGCYYPSTHVPYQTYVVVQPVYVDATNAGDQSTGVVEGVEAPVNEEEVAFELPPLPGEEDG
jgi:hypothetical protein